MIVTKKNLRIALNNAFKKSSFLNLCKVKINNKIVVQRFTGEGWGSNFESTVLIEKSNYFTPLEKYEFVLIIDDSERPRDMSGGGGSYKPTLTVSIESINPELNIPDLYNLLTNIENELSKFRTKNNKKYIFDYA